MVSSKNSNVSSIGGERLFSERVPPQDLEAEQSVLGSMLLEGAAIPHIMQVVEPRDFYAEKHNHVFTAIVTLYGRHEPVDLITLSGELRKNGHLEDVGGISYLTNLINAVPTTANAIAYARLVADKATIRRVQLVGRRIVDSGYTATNAEDIKRVATDELQQAFASGRSTVMLRKLGPDLLEFVESSYNDSLAGKANVAIVPSGFQLQDYVIPFVRGETTVVVSSSGMGKTTYEKNLQRNLGKAGLPVAGFSLEMSRTQIKQKYWALLAGINTLKIRHSSLTEEEWQRSLQAAYATVDWPLYYALKPRMKWSDIRLEVVSFKAKHGSLAMFTVDYWQIIGDKPPKGEERHEMLGRLVEDAKELAVEMDCHALILAQAKIDSNKPIPTLEDVKDSRAIVQAADNILFLTRPLEFGTAEIALPRNDGKGWVNVKCNAPYPHIEIHGEQYRGRQMFEYVMLGIQGKQRMGPKDIIPYWIDLPTGRMADLGRPWPWDNERGATPKQDIPQ